MVPAPAPQSAATTGSTNHTSSSNSNSNSNSTNGYEEALDRLQPLQPILQGFNHRNRNQHRRAAWWAPFGMLRRHVDKLADELLDSAAAANAAARSKSKKRKRDNDDGRAEKKVRDHVKWLRDVLVPKCYLAFSQLTADNQFATLGVVLLGALAQVNAACTGLIGEAAPAVEEQTSISSTRELASIAGTNTHLKDSSRAGSREPSFRPTYNGVPEVPRLQGGGVISRDEVARAEKLRRKNTQLEGRDEARSSNSLGDMRKEQGHIYDAASREEQQHKISSKGKARGTDDAPNGEEMKPTKKKKKTKKGGDEFDALFKGLF
ncbi:hypothetical protein F4776DRAFT_382639 [Hypoxylon sp. NC0597]|nr:hypothetical protein F4776DRAFT_382639 [Hypoxylon sp. NC0597]